jgi:hypothetical protein
MTVQTRAVALAAPSISQAQMLRTEYCLARAERLRMLMLIAPNLAAEVRLRGLVLKYKALAERAKRKVESRPFNGETAI